MKFRFRAKQGEPATIVGRIRDIVGNPIKQALISSIIAYNYDTKNGNALVPGFPLTVSIPAVVSDLFQQGPLWQDTTGRPIDSIGYNFVWTSPQNAFPNFSAGQKYRVEFEVTLTSGTKFTGECDVDIDQILTAPLP